MLQTPSSLVLADGNVFEGYAIGAPGEISTGELVFNTAMTGYQEVITDPSYAGQVITFTYPHIGNYGTNNLDSETTRSTQLTACKGIVVRQLMETPSSWRSSQSLGEWMVDNGVSGIGGIDTRRLTRVLRDYGSLTCAFGTASESELKDHVRSASSTDGCDLVQQVTCSHVWTVDSQTVGEFERPRNRLRVVALDYGIKRTILRHLAQRAEEVVVVPAGSSAEDILAMNPSGVFLSNGPGDPAALAYAVEAVRSLLGKVPMFGICLGHQILGTALGASTFKLKFGHHGANHPIKDLATGRVFITSQNHNYCVDPSTLSSNASVTQLNLNDQTVEGLAAKDLNAFSVQYHPEAGPGPHEAATWFDSFVENMKASI